MTKYAYCTCLLNTKNVHNYFKLLLTMYYSLRKCISDKVDIICIVETGVPIEIINNLRLVYTNVYVEDPIYINGDYIKQIIKKWRKEDMYNHWINKVCTKFNVLKYIKYDKIALLDSDLVSINNLKNNKCSTNIIFSYNCPAGVLSIKNNYRDNNKVNVDIVYKSLRSFGMRGSLYLFKPNIDVYKQFINYINSNQIISWINSNLNKISAGPDELLITLFFKDKWYSLEDKWLSMSWKNLYTGYFYHYNDIKPWVKGDKYDTFEDYRLWRLIYKKSKKLLIKKIKFNSY